MKFARRFPVHSNSDHSPAFAAGELTVLLQSQEEAWRSGGLLSLESLEATLSKDEKGVEQLMCLICNEVYLREQRGEKPELTEYQHRFPQLENALRIQWAVDELLDFHRSSTGNSGPQLTTPPNSRGPNSQQQSAHKDRLGTMLNGRYQLEREIGNGGMGVVYLANDSYLGREVAIKMLHSLKSCRSETLSRFRAEAEILARTVHPHLVQVFDVGEPDDEPFIVMEYCDAGSLADYLRGIPVEPRLAASWMQRIVDGVSAAHKMDVAHRDLKPSNILLTHSTKNSSDTKTQNVVFNLDRLDQLTTKISDFGLAKQVDVSQQLTVTGETIGTPAYMAPEQIGALPGIDPMLSDIYSLGAVLYECLTGRPPFQAATPLETLSQVQNREPVEPRRLNATIPRDLETIVLKCLAKKPRFRYETAAELTEDLDRFLKGKPIRARPTSKLEHAWRLVKRNPMVSSLSAAVVASLVIGLGVSLWFYFVAANREEQATKNFDIALSTVKKYLTDVADSPELKSTGLEPLRRNLLTTAQEFYQQLEQQSKDSIAGERLTDVHYNLGEINLELGEWSEADRYFQQSIEGLESQVSASANSTPLLLRVGEAYQMQSKSRKPSDPQGWEESIRSANRIFRDLERQSSSPSVKLAIASSLADFGIHLDNTDRVNESLEAFNEVDAICRELLGQIQATSDTTAAKRLLEILDYLALHKQQHGKFVESEELLLAAEDLAKSLITLEPDDQQLLFQIARLHKNLNMIFTRLQRFDEAESRFKQSHEIFQRLTREHPLVLAYLDDNATLCMNRAVSLAQRGDIDGADTAMQIAYPLQLELVTKQPGVFINNWTMGLLCSNHGFVLQKSGKLSECETKLEEALRYFGNAKQIDPNDTNLMFGMTGCQLNLGNLYRDEGRTEEAKVLYENAVNDLTELVSKAPSVVNFRKHCIIGNINLATTCRELGELDRAIQAVEAAKAMIDTLVKEQPDSVDYKSTLASVLTVEGEVLSETGDLLKSQKCFEQAIEILGSLVVTAENGERFQVNLAYAFSGLTRVQLRQEVFVEALQTSGQALEAYGIEMRLREGKSAAENRTIRERLCFAHRDRARALLGLKRTDEAKDACQQGLTLQTGKQADSLRALYGRVLAMNGESKEAEKVLAQINLDTIRDRFVFADLAKAYSALSQDASTDERVLRILEKAK